MDKKRIFIAIGFFILCIAMAYLIYRFFFASKTPVPIPNEGTISTSTLGVFPEAGRGGTTRPSTGTTTLPTSEGRPSGIPGTQTGPRVSQVISDSINGVEASKNGMRYYNQQDGKFYRLGADGKALPLDDKVFFNVNNVTWAPQKDEGILEYPDGSNIYYNFETKRQVTLPKHWEEFSFSPDSSKIAAKSIGISNEGNWLLTAGSDGREVKLVEPLGDNANSVDVNWSPNQQVVALARTGEALGDDREEVLFVGQNHENFKSMSVEGRGMVSEWSPSGNKLLYSVYSQRSDFKPELWIVSSQGGTIGAERKLLNLNTWADKCTFSDERYIYCGVPQKLETGSGFVPSTADQTPDTLFKIDTQTGTKTPLATDENHVIKSMFLGEDGKTLFFTDKNQNGLFQISL